jgi:predicted phage terminase large subunit-like protein
VAGAWNEGRVLVPDDTPSWLDPFLDELANFTGTSGDQHDDQVDALSHAWNSSVPSMFDLY